MLKVPAASPSFPPPSPLPLPSLSPHAPPRDSAGDRPPSPSGRSGALLLAALARTQAGGWRLALPPEDQTAATGTDLVAAALGPSLRGGARSQAGGWRLALPPGDQTAALGTDAAPLALDARGQRRGGA